MTIAPDSLSLRLAALSGLAFVALAAFGAHGFKLEGQALDWWKTANLHHGITTALMLTLALLGRQARTALWCALTGTLLFSGLLYVMALTHMKTLGALVPLGGLLMLAAWTLLFTLAWRHRHEERAAPPAPLP